VESRLSRSKLALGLVQCVKLRLRVELRNNIVRLYHLPDFDTARDQAAVNAECDAFVRAGPDVTGERYRFSVGAGDSSDGPHGPDFGLRLRLIAASQENQGDTG
jgi:hypothetical protein